MSKLSDFWLQVYCKINVTTDDWFKPEKASVSRRIVTTLLLNLWNYGAKIDPTSFFWLFWSMLEGNRRLERIKKYWIFNDIWKSELEVNNNWLGYKRNNNLWAANIIRYLLFQKYFPLQTTVDKFNLLILRTPTNTQIEF